MKTKLKPSMTCEVDGCDREATICGLCGPCYQAEYYWQKKGIAERRKRRKNLEIFSARMERLTAPKLRSVK